MMRLGLEEIFFKKLGFWHGLNLLFLTKVSMCLSPLMKQLHFLRSR